MLDRPRYHRHRHRSKKIPFEIATLRLPWLLASPQRGAGTSQAAGYATLEVVKVRCPSKGRPGVALAL